MITRKASLALLGALAVLVLGASPAGAAIPHRDLSYDRGTPPADPNLNALDVYQPDGGSAADERPVVVYVHGGAWRAGDKRNQITDKVNLFTGAGYVFVSLNYRLSPQDVTALDPGRVRFPDHPDDVGEAFGWIADHVDEYGGDPTRLLLIGHSAGAHLVSLVATDPRYAERHGVEPWRILGAVPLDSDAYDVADRIAEVEGRDTAYVFYSAFATPAENAADDTWRRASPITWADRRDPRHLLITQAGAPGRVVDNQAMASALGQDPAGVFLAPYDHEGINDAVGGANDTAGETAAIMDFFRAAVADSADPRASFADPPPKRIRTSGRRAKLKFELDSTEPHSKFRCRLDSPKLKPCKRKETLRAKPGKHVLRYQAVSDRGRPGPVKKFRFRVVRKG